ncbi:MAG: universal stress protein [Alphaproteobacteria bacterium]|jgi:nucleotide-binding universal stress UspA family protein
MSIKTVMLALIAGDGTKPGSAIDYAIDLAATHKAHLSVVIGAIRVPVVVYSGVAEVQAIVTDENNHRDQDAGVIAESIRHAAQMNGIAASVDIVSDSIDSMFNRIGKRARLHDLAVCGRPRATDIWARELAETLLLSSGRPLIVVPDGFAVDRASGTIMVAWDGTAVSARAVGEATPFLERAGLVEVVSVSGDKHADDLVPGADLAPMLAHHGMKVSVVDLPGSAGAGETIISHAQNIRARLIVMGGYAHSRLRQMVLGGCTRTMLDKAPVPVFMAH